VLSHFDVETGMLTISYIMHLRTLQVKSYA